MTRQIRFAEWSFDPKIYLLAKGDYQETLEPRVARLLEFFVDNAGQVLGPDRLMEGVWDGRVVSDEAIRRCVSSLRQALGRGGSGDYIRTVSKAGYIAKFPPPADPVQTQSPDGESPFRLQAKPADAATHRKWHGTVWALAGGGGVAILATLVYFTVPRQATHKPAAPKAISVAAPATIAVLPFMNVSKESNTDYISDGLTEELQNLLGRIDAFRVTARSSSFQFKGRNEDVRKIGHKLGVRYVLEGSVRKAADHVRVGVQLIDARTGFQMWTDTYDRRLADLFAVQRDIAAQVARALNVVIVSAGTPRLALGGTHDTAAHLRYLRAAALAPQGWNAWTEARKELEQALARDPDYVQAMNFLAELYLDLHQGGAMRREVAIAKMQPLVNRALRLAPDLAETQVTLGRLEHLKGNDIAYEAAISRALALNPSSTDALVYEYEIADAHGDVARVLDLAERLVTMDPLNPSQWQGLVLAYMDNGRMGNATEAAQQLQALAPNNGITYKLLADLNRYKGNLVESYRYAEKRFAVRETMPTRGLELVPALYDLDAFKSARRLAEEYFASQPETERRKDLKTAYYQFFLLRDYQGCSATFQSVQKERGTLDKFDLNLWGACLVLAGNADTAVAYYQRWFPNLLKENPNIGNDIDQTPWVVAALQAAGRPYQALLQASITTLAHARDNGRHGKRFRLVVLYAERGDTPAAVKELKRVLNSGLLPLIGDAAFERLPLPALRAAPEFQHLHAGIDARKRAMREELAKEFPNHFSADAGPSTGDSGGGGT